MKAAVPALSALAALAVAACGGESDGTFDRDGFPFTFSYPEGFEETDDVDIAQPVGAQAVENVAIGIGDHDLIVVQRFNLQVEITRSNLPAAKREFDALLRQIDPQASATRAGQVAGVPALTASGVSISSVEDGLSDFTFLLDGDQEYVINCQSTPEHRTEIAEACDQAIDTLSFD